MKSLIIKNFIYKFTLEILRMIIPIISIPYIYKMFSPNLMGKIEFSQSIVGYFFIFAGFGVYRYGLREISCIKNNEKKRNKLFTELFIISSLSSSLITGVYLFYVNLKFNEDFILKNMLLVNTIQIASYIFYIEWINEAFENYKFISQKTMIIKFINLICIFIFIKTSQDFYKYLFLVNIFYFINNFISFIYIKRYINFDFKNIELKKYLIPLFIILLLSNLNILYTQFDKIILGFYCNNINELAYYGVSQKIVALVQVILTSIISISISRLAYYVGNELKKNFINFFNKVYTYAIFILSPASVGIIILRKEILYIFGGKLYQNAEIVIFFFSIYIIISTVESLLSNHVIFLHKKEGIIIKICAIGGILNVFFKIILIKLNLLNAINSILTTLLVQFLMIILDYWYIKKYLKLKLEVFKLKNLKYLLISLIFFPIKYFFSDLNFNIMINSILIFIMCSSAYFILLLLIKDRCLFELLEKIDIKKYIFRRK